jgi:uncharacterized protein
MTIKEHLEIALREAMKSGDVTRKQTVRMVLSAVKLEEVERGKPLEDNELVSILQKEVKSRREAIGEAEKAGRPDLIQAGQAEIAVLDTFLPRQLSDEDLTSIVKAAILEVNATTPADMGKVMKVVMAKVAGKAAGDRISSLVKQLLQG